MDRIYLIDLYDIYGELLNDKQKEYFENYYFNNLSLGEISDNLGVSRNAIHKEIKLVESKLKDYESKLELHKKNIKLKSIISEIKDEELKKKLEKLSW